MRIFLACIIVFLSGCAAGDAEIPELLEPVGVNLDLAVTSYGEIYNISVYDATVVPPVEKLYFTADGTIGTFNVMLGQTVQSGDVVATLDQSALEDQIASLGESIAFTEKTLEYQTAIAETDIRIKELELAKLQNEPVDDEQAAMRQTEIDLLQLDVEGLKMEIEQSAQTTRLELNQMRGELKTLQGMLGQGKISAPYAGNIAYSAGLNRGDQVSAYVPLVYIAAINELRIESTYISDSSSGNLHEVYALIADEKYSLTHVPTEQGEYFESLTSGAPLTSKFMIDNAEEALSKLSPGMYAAVCVITDYVKSALVIPANALYREDKTCYVYVMQKDARVRREVEIGVTNNILTQIVSGLKEGETVYVNN